MTWRSRAKCAGQPTDWFFPPARVHGSFGERWTPPDEAIALCQACPVRKECAKAGRGEQGMWGGVVNHALGSRRYHAKPAEPDEDDERVDLSRERVRTFFCPGCGKGFLSVQGQLSHQAYKKCGRDHPRLSLAQEVAVLEASLISIEDELEALG